MQRFELRPVLASDIPEVACILHKRGEDGPAPEPVGEGPPTIERRLRWLLLGSPFSTSESSHGYCVRDSSGTIKGLELSFPNAFLAGSRRLMGLCSTNYFVDPPARTMGFHLFKRYLATPGFSLFFSTTCNVRSAPLWETLGGHAVPNSELEYLFPLRLSTLLPALLAGKTSNKAALAITQLLGSCGDRILRLSNHRSNGITTEPCQDWEKLSYLFQRHRSHDFITTDRSPEFLEWRYGQNPDMHPCGVYLFRDRCGNEGWFSLGRVVRGRRRQIAGCVLLDTVWPRERVGLGKILSEIFRLAGGRFDLLSVAPQPGLDCDACDDRLIPRRLAVPGSFVIARHGDLPSMAAAMDLCWADGDGALPAAPNLRRPEVVSAMEPGGGNAITKGHKAA
jgi:hypothetical protein